MKNRTKHLLTAACLWACASGAWAQGTPDIKWQRGFGAANMDEIISLNEEPNNDILLGMRSASNFSSGLKNTPNHGLSDYWIGITDSKGDGTSGSAFIWERCYGSTANDELSFAYSATTNIVAGGTSYGGIGGVGGSGRTIPLKGISDGWVILMARTGGAVIQRSYGGSGNEIMADMVETSTGYVFVISSNSPAGLISPTNNKTVPNLGGYDIWVVETDFSGNVTNEKVYGGTADDIAHKIILTSNNEFVITGTTQSGSNASYKTSGAYGLEDYWVIKLDQNLNLLWDRTYGGNDIDENPIAVEMPSGDFWVAGTSDSPGMSGNKIPSNINGSSDIWLVKLTSSGGVLPQDVIGGNSDEQLGSFIKTSDNNYVISCSSFSGQTGNKSMPLIGVMDTWVFKMNSNASICWQKSLGGSATDFNNDVIQTFDDHILVGGQSFSPAGLPPSNKTTPNNGMADGWMVKLFNSAYWDNQYEANNIWSENRIWSHSIAEGDDYFWDISQVDQYGYWLLGVDKTSGHTYKSRHHDFPGNIGDFPVIKDFPLDLLVAGNNMSSGFVKYEINKLTGDAINGSQVDVMMSLGNSTDGVETHPVEFIQAGGQKIMLAFHSNPSIMIRPSLVLLNTLNAVSAISHIEDPMMPNVHLVPCRALVMGNELLIVGSTVSNTSSSIFTCKINLSSGLPASPIKYYTPTGQQGPVQRIVPAEITVTMINNEVRIGYAISDNSGMLWPGMLLLNSNLNPAGSYYYTPNITGVINGHSGQLLSIPGNPNIMYPATISFNGTDKIIMINVDGNTGIANPQNYIYDNQNSTSRVLSSAMITNQQNGQENILMGVNGNDFGKSLILTSPDPNKIDGHPCVEEFTVNSNPLIFNVIQRPFSVVTDNFNEYPITINNSAELGDRYACNQNSGVSYKKAMQTKPTSTTSIFDIITQKEEIDVKVWRSEDPGVFNVKSEEDIQSIKVFDMIGKLVFSTHKNSTSQQVNLAHMPSGVYIFQVETLAGMRSEKVVK
ncbi:T9SS type A sorting domain-containing protein [bacterium SCSIO 12643]|nr:T9SS type A sorting domain-containing protein [bacterium SCSIO 12643]